MNFTPIILLILCESIGELMAVDVKSEQRWPPLKLRRREPRRICLYINASVL